MSTQEQRISKDFHKTSAYPLRILMRAHQQLDDAWNGSVFAQRRVVPGAQRKVADEPDDGLDEGPATGGVQQFDDPRQAVVHTHRVLRLLRTLVATRQVAQRADLQRPISFEHRPAATNQL